MTPSDFNTHPADSILQKSEPETIALNIMIILSRTGNTFRMLSKDEYIIERNKDGGFSEKELPFFDAVVEHTSSLDKAKDFSNYWGN